MFGAHFCRYLYWVEEVAFYFHWIDLEFIKCNFLIFWPYIWFLFFSNMGNHTDGLPFYFQEGRGTGACDRVGKISNGISCKTLVDATTESITTKCSGEPFQGF